jgi:hypothetical protein
MLCSRILFYDGCNLDGSVVDSVNNYSKAHESKSVTNKGEIIAHLNDKKYRIILIAGHGCKNEISVGAGMGGPNMVYDKTKEITLKNFQDSTTFFKRCLIKHFDKENGMPILFLVGCEIFDSVFADSKPSLLKKISCTLQNVLVIAPATLVKPELKEDRLKIELEVKPGTKADFDFILTLAAFKNGEKIEDMDQILKLTKCEDEKTLRGLLCKWKIEKENG